MRFSRRLRVIFIVIIGIFLATVFLFIVNEFCPLRIITTNNLTISPDISKIAFIGRWRKGFLPHVAEGRDVFIVDIDGKALQKLTNFRILTGIVRDFGWGPKGKKIIYAVFGAIEQSLWLVNLDDSKKREIVSYESSFITHCRFIQSSKILFEKNDIGDAISELWIVNFDGADLRKLLEHVDRNPIAPNWTLSSDEETLFFVKKGNLHMIKLDGTEEQVLTSDLDITYLAPMYKGGKEILFREEKTGICTINIETYGQISIFARDSDMEDVRAVWSSDGKQIAFIYNTRNPYAGHLCVINKEGNNLKVLQKGSFFKDIQWLSNKEIIFGKDKNTIWIMNADGTNQRQIFPKP